MPFKVAKKAVFEILLRLAAANVRWFGCFDGESYLKANRDVALADYDPVRHYLLYGKAEARNLFPDAHNRVQEQAAVGDGLEQLVFVRVYRALVQLVQSQFNAEQWQSISKIRDSGLFDGRFYLENYPDVLDSGMDPIAHFVVFGSREGRNPNPEFDTVGYAMRMGISHGSGINPFVHYIESLGSAGQLLTATAGAGRRDHGIAFDTNFYLRKYADLANADVDPYEHFISHGVYEGRDAGVSKNGYSEWRRSFVLRAQVPESPEVIHPVEPRVTVCLAYEGQQEEEIRRTLESLGQQHTDFALVTLAVTTDVKPLLNALEENAALSGSKPEIFRTLREMLECFTDADDCVCFVRAGDQLIRGAIQVLKHAVLTHPEVALFYSDEEVVDIKELLIKPLFKGGYDPDLQLERDYVGSFFAVSAQSLAALEPGDNDPWRVARRLLLSQLFSQLQGTAVHHIPNILYRRISEEEWDRETLEHLASRVKETVGKSVVPIGPLEGAGLIDFRVRYSLPEQSNKASIIIPTRNGLRLLSSCIQSILKKTGHRNFEIIIIDNGSDDAATIRYLASLERERSNIRVIRHDHPFNYSELNNLGAAAASGDFLVFLNNDVEVISPDWLEELLAQAARPEVGVAGPMLLFADGTIQHAGVVLGVGGVAAHAFSGWHPDSEEFQPHRHTRRVAAVTGACLVMRRSVFEAADGFEEDTLPVDFNDVDLCLRVRQLGLATMFTPHVSLHHFESKTRVSHRANSVQAERFEREVQWMQLRWFDTLTDDPYYNRNYSLGLPAFKLAWPPREPMQSRRAPAAPNLDRYVTHSNVNRAAEVVRTMGRAPHTLSAITHAIPGRERGLSIIILNLDKPEFIVPLIESMANAEEYFRARGLGFEILVGDTGSTDARVLAMYEAAPPFVQVLHGLQYQFSRCNNQVFADLSRYDTVLFLNNDIEFEGSAARTLFELQDFLHETPDAGVVGAQLLFPDRTIQHAGIGVFENGSLRGFVYHPDAHKPEYPADHFPREMWAVTGACLMMKAADFTSVGGFDEGYRTECQDAALCLAVRRRGKTSYVLSPDVIIHFENGTREKGSEDWPDRQRFMRHWGSWIDMELGEVVR